MITPQPFKYMSRKIIAILVSVLVIVIFIFNASKNRDQDLEADGDNIPERVAGTFSIDSNRIASLGVDGKTVSMIIPAEMEVVDYNKESKESYSSEIDFDMEVSRPDLPDTSFWRITLVSPADAALHWTESFQCEPTYPDAVRPDFCDGRSVGKTGSGQNIYNYYENIERDGPGFGGKFEWFFVVLPEKDVVVVGSFNIMNSDNGGFDVDQEEIAKKWLLGVMKTVK